jgi:4-hydroxy-tetrahydrodipicolinate reductase
MGATVCQAVIDDPDLELVGAVDPQHAGFELSEVARVAVQNVQVGPSIQSFEGLELDVVVDFTQVEAARANLDWLAANGVHAVVGTTGFTAGDYERFRSSFVKSNCVIAPNFAIGAVLMMRFAELAAPYFETAEVVEYHHDEKVDAPSGTAVLTAERMADASDEWNADPTTNEVVDRARGGKGPGGIPVHSVRLKGMVAHQEVLLGTAGQSLTIRHDAYDRSSFMPGVLMAVKAIPDHPGLTVGLDALLGLA